MTTFTRYFDNSINEWIDTVELHNLVVRIRGMDLNEAVDFSESQQVDVRIDPSYERTKTFRVVAKTLMRRMQELRNSGQKYVRGGKPSLFEYVEAAMIGTIIGDEFIKRIKG